MVIDPQVRAYALPALTSFAAKLRTANDFLGKTTYLSQLSPYSLSLKVEPIDVTAVAQHLEQLGFCPDASRLKNLLTNGNALWSDDAFCKTGRDATNDDERLWDLQRSYFEAQTLVDKILESLRTEPAHVLRFSTKDDGVLQSTITRWKQTAAEECDDIEGWRDHTEERLKCAGDPSRYWHDAPQTFFSDSSYLCGAITAQFPHFDPKPIQDVHAAVTAWYADHNASHVPSAPELYLTLDRAMMTLNAIEHVLQTRLIRKNHPPARHVVSPESPPVPKPLVELLGQGQRPVVCGEPVTALSNAYYSVVEALVKAGRDGLDFDAVTAVKGDAPKYLRILTGKQSSGRPAWLPARDTKVWAKAIRIAGTANRGYAVVYSDS